MFKYLIRLFTVFSLLFPVVTHAAISTEFQTCMDSARAPESCAKVEYVGCERPERCDASATCTATTDGCTVKCTWSGCSSIIQIVPAEICKQKQVPAGCLEVSYDGTCTEYSSPCQLGDDDCGCEVKFNGCYATCEFNCGQGYYITSNTGGIIGKTCAKCGDGCTCDGVNEVCSGQPQCENGYWLNGECLPCPDYAVCYGGKITICNWGYRKVSNSNGDAQCICPKEKYENLATGKCETCPGLLTNGICIPCSDGQVVNGACVSCPKGLVENGVCVDCTKNGTCKNGTFTGCNASYIKYYGTDGLACVACGDRCMDNSTCPLYGECSTDTSNTGPEFEQCMDGFTMFLDLDAGSVKCLCDGKAYIDSSGQCVACLANAVCSDEKVTGCEQGFQKLTDESGNIIGCAGCTPNGTCSNGVFQYCNANYYGDENGCYKCPDYASLTGQSTAGNNKYISNCRVEGQGEDERGYFSFESGTCNATNVTIE